MTVVQFVWHLSGPHRTGARRGPVFVLDKDYVPLAVTAYAKVAPTSASVLIDLNDDGTSIFNGDFGRVTIVPAQVKGEGTFDPTLSLIREESVLTLDLDSSGDITDDLTVVLLMERKE